MLQRTIIIISGLLLFLSTTFSYAQKNKIKSKAQSVLFGVVLDKQTNKPITNALVQLKDLETENIEIFTTKQNGNFYFQLANQKQYQVAVLDEAYNLADAQLISTVHKSADKIMHTILEAEANFDLLSGTDTDTYELNPIIDTYEITPYDQAGMNYFGEETANEGLTFKVQIGSLSDGKAPNNTGLKQISKHLRVKVERALNGGYRYVVGNYKDFQQAATLQKELQTHGYKEVNVVAYLEGYRLEMPIKSVLKRYYKQ